MSDPTGLVHWCHLQNDTASLAIAPGQADFGQACLAMGK
jgi:hypothetical protein